MILSLISRWCRCTTVALAVILATAASTFPSSLSISNNRGDPGDTAISVSVSLDNAFDYAGMELTLNYDKTILSLNRIEAASRLAGISDVGYNEFTAGKVASVIFDISGADILADTGAILNLFFDISPDTNYVDALIDIIEATAVKSDMTYDSLTVDSGSISLPSYICGDIDSDGSGPDVADLTYFAAYVFLGGPPPPIITAADVNLTGGLLDISDITYLVCFLFFGGSAPCHPGTAKLAPPAIASKASPIDLSSIKASRNQYEIQITADLPSNIAGFQQEYRITQPMITVDSVRAGHLNADVDVYWSAENGTLSLGLVDLQGKHLLNAGNSVIAKVFFTTSQDITLTQQHFDHKKTIVADRWGRVVLSEVEDGRLLTQIPTTFSLSQNYPNPFNPSTVIKFALPKNAHVVLDIYNILGRKVITLIDEVKNAGYHTVRWDGENESGGSVATGVYFYRISAGEFESSKKMMLIK